MNAVDAALGLYEIVDPGWNFAVSCDWQCRPEEEQTAAMEVQPKQAELQSETLDEKDAEIGLYQVVDPSWNFMVSCDWQCSPEGEAAQPARSAVQPTLDEKDSQIGPTDEQLVQPAQPPARTKCNVPLAESDARVGLYQMVDHRWDYVVSCDWQCKTRRERKSKATERQPRKVDEGKIETREARSSKVQEVKSKGVPLSEADAQVGLYQQVSSRWDHVVSCDWQCRPLGEPVDEVPEAEPAASAAQLPEPVKLPQVSSVPLSESDAQIGLYQLVHPKWNYCVSCDWQVRPPGESVEQDIEEIGHVAQVPSGLSEEVSVEALGECVEEDFVSTSSLSVCREDGEDVGLYQQTGDIMLTLVGDEGEMGVVMIDEGSAADLMVSSDIAIDEQAAECRKRELEQLMTDLTEDAIYEVGQPMCEIMYGWAVHTKPPVEAVVVKPKHDKERDKVKGRKESKPTAPPAAKPAPRTLPAMYGWAIRPPCPVEPEPEVEPELEPEVPPSGPCSRTTSVAVSAAPSSKHPTTQASASVRTKVTVGGTAQASVENVCAERRRRHHDKSKVRYEPVTKCAFVSCGPTKPLRTFREKPDSCLPRRK